MRKGRSKDMLTKKAIDFSLTTLISISNNIGFIVGFLILITLVIKGLDLTLNIIWEDLIDRMINLIGKLADKVQ